MRPGGIPTRKQLERATFANPDGNGYAIVMGDEIVVGKSFKKKHEIIDEFLALREISPHTPAIFHCRLGTEGVKTDLNVHPFPVGKGNKTFLAHNGIFNFRVPKGDTRSDTHFFAAELAPWINLQALDEQPFIWEQMCETSYNKVAFLTVDPRLEEQLYIVGEEKGHWNEKKTIWWSNHTYSNTYYDHGKRFGGVTLGVAEGAWTRDNNWGKWGVTPTDRPALEECTGEEAQLIAVDEEDEDYYDGMLGLVGGKCLTCGSQSTEYGLLHDFCEYCDHCFKCGAEWMDCECEKPLGPFVVEKNLDFYTTHKGEEVDDGGTVTFVGKGREGLISSTEPPSNT